MATVTVVVVQYTLLEAFVATVTGVLEGAVTGAALGPVGIAGYLLNLNKMYLFR